jgi:ribonuclease HI
LVKQKAKLSRTIPTSTLLHPQIYNVKNIWDIQLQHHITNYIKRLNNLDLLGISSLIRLQQLQNNLWSTSSILSHPNPIIDGPNKSTTNFKIIQLINHLGWNVSSNNASNIPFTLNEGTVTLESILSSHPKYSIFKKQIRHCQLLFLDQLTTYDNICLLDWKHISPRLNKLPKGRIPTWFSVLEETTISHSYHRKLYDKFNFPETNYFSYTTGHFSHKPKPWLITILNEQIIVGKARRQPTTNDLTLITHWQCDIQFQFTCLYPILPTTTYICPGCNLNSQIIPSKCTILIPTNLATKFFGRINNISKSINFNANYLDLIYSIAIRNPISIPLSPHIIIQPSQIPSIFSSNLLNSQLQTITNHNSNSTELTFYTDGSVINLATAQCSMGISWIQTTNSIIAHTFQAQIQNWPCSFKAELTAILSAIITAPRGCTVHIHTDSQSVISKYNSISKSLLPLQYHNTLYFSIWNTLINFINSYQLNIIFHKVIAHSNNELNNAADQLARNHLNLPFLSFNSNNIYNSSFTFTSNNLPIELPTRRSIRTICHAHIYSLWSSQHRVQIWSEITSLINWQATWLYLNNNQKITNFSHNFQSSTLKSFKVKILLDELPTPHILHKRNSSYSPYCHKCNQISTPLHWALCSTNQPIQNLIHTSLRATLNCNSLNTSLNIANSLHQQILNLNSLQIHNTSNLPSLISTLSGLIPLDIIQTINNEIQSHKISTTLSIKFLLHLNNQLYTQIWIPYCISRSQISSPQLQLTSFVTPSSSHTIALSNSQITTKIDTWYLEWIKYQVHPSYIFTLPQI